MNPPEHHAAPDAPEREPAGAALPDADAFYRGVFWAAADAILVADGAGRYLDANHAAAALLGYTREEVLRLHVADVVAPGAGWAAAEYGRFLREGAWSGELELRRRDGTLVPVEARATVVPRGEGGPAYLSMLRDISSRREAERERERLHEAERAARAAAEAARGRLQEIVQQAPAMIAVLRGPEHVFAMANPRYERGSGRAAGALIGRPVRAAFPELAGQGLYELPDAAYRTGTPYAGTETPVRLDRAGDGALEDIYVTFTCQPLRDAAGAVEGTVVIAVEVTAYVRARQRGEGLALQLREERDRLRQVLDALPEAILIADATPAFLACNRAARELLGADATGQPVPMADEEAYRAYGTRRLDGTPCPSPDLPLQRALLRDEVVQGDQFLIRNARDGRDVPVLANAAPLHDAAGAVAGGVVVFQDITAIRDLERAREEFLSSAAHDLKTPLTTIRGHTELAQRRLARLGLPEAAPVVDQLARIAAATDAMLGLIGELLDLTRQRMGGGLELRREPADLVALVRGCVEAQGEASGRPIRLEAGAPEVRASVDAGRMERVVGNLLSNALTYGPAGSPIVVRLGLEAGAGGPQALIAVRDEGIGIPAADLPHIFDRFRRAGNAAGHSQGTGIGLASARGIVEQHGGTIAVESSEGAGATFTVRLPLAMP